MCTLTEGLCGLCQAQLLSQGFSEMSKTCWLRTASPLLAPQELRVLRAAYWNLFLLARESLPPSLTHFSPQKVASWMPVPLFKWHLPKEEFSKTE